MHPRPKRSKSAARATPEQPATKKHKSHGDRSHSQVTDELPTHADSEPNQSIDEPSTATSPQKGESPPKPAADPTLADVPDFDFISRNLVHQDRWLHYNDGLFGPLLDIRLGNYFWPAFQRAIGDFYRSCLPEVINWDVVDKKTEENLVSFAPKARQYIDLLAETNTWLGSQLFFEAWILRILCDNLFSPDSVDKWRPGPWASFGRIYRATKDEIEPRRNNALTCTFFSWKHDSAQMLYTFHGDHSDPARLKEMIQSQLGPFIKANGAAWHEVESKLDKLVKKAIEIDLLAIASRYDVRIEMSDPESGRIFGFPFKEDCMQSSFPHRRPTFDGQHVDFVSRPLVRFFGETNFLVRGNIYHDHQTHLSVMNYDVETILFPLEVAVGQFPDDESGEASGTDEESSQLAEGDDAPANSD